MTKQTPLAHVIKLFLFLTQIFSLMPGFIELLLLNFKESFLFPELFSFKFDTGNHFFIGGNLSKKVSISILFIQKLLDESLATADSSRSFDILKSNLNGIKLHHLAMHLISQQSLNESSAKIAFVPILLHYVLVLKCDQCYFFHLLISDLLVHHHILLFVQHA